LSNANATPTLLSVKQSDGPNPLWAINIGMGVFLGAIALTVILG